jgi:hypothetical protein
MTTTYYKLHHATNFAKECYVGSTTNYAHRIITHKSVCNNPKVKEFKLKVYKYIRNNSGFDNWNFSILEHVDNDDYTKIELLQMEMNFIEEHGASLNSAKPGALLSIGKQAYDGQRYDTDNLCDRCDTTYRSKANKNKHQNTAKCKRLQALKLLQEAEALE